MSNNFLFDTDGTWDNTSVIWNNKQVDVSRIGIAVKTERNKLTDKVSHRTLEASMVSLAMNGDQPTYGDREEYLLPGRVELTFPLGTIVLSGEGNPVDPMKVRIEFEAIDVTESVNELFIEVDSPRDTVTAYLTLFHGHPIPIFGPDHVDEIDLLK